MNLTEKDGMDDYPDAEREDLFIVGIGASAGGIQALQAFFSATPPDSGMAFVVILHLSPDHDSKLAEVLQVTTAMPVARVMEKTHVLPNHVYVVPPNQHLTMEDGSIIVSPNVQPEDRHAPVDIFFRTLGESHGPRAVCVVLSGTGANGSMGLKMIKEAGGAAFVQNPREAEFNEMPRTAISTDLVDEVLPVAEIPGRIIAYAHSLGAPRAPVDTDRQPEDAQHALRDILTQLRVRTGHDFSNYKRPTLVRRIERRMNIRDLPDLIAYAHFVQQHPEEVNALLKDLLISVTNFFRDRAAFEALAQDVLPQVTQGKTADDQVRIWVAGCATGEEAYSLAILCAEQTLHVIDAPKIQIFATDIDEQAINHGRDGYYTINEAADVSPERLRRFFTREGEGYRIRREIREMILFANHNFIKDPPFSHLDIISCRNVLIYLNRTAQLRVMETFHFALNAGSFLFLGSSESAEAASDLFSIASRDHHIFQSRKKMIRSFPVPESVPTFNIEQPRVPSSQISQESRAVERMTFGDLHQRLLEEYAPPSIVVNAEYDIIHLSERAGRYLQIMGGELSQNLLKLVRQELRLELRSALYQATQRQSAVEARALKVTIAEKVETVNVHVRPVLRDGDVAKGFILVLFERSAGEAPEQQVVLSSDEPVARQLEEELMRLKSQLRASIEQHEFHAEELKASNEELQAMNEELRSAAEELETSKEELQSINEELRTVNQELKIKVEEMSLTSNNLQNLINSASIGTIFLDRSFRIALFTPAIRNIFNLIPGDLGRPLSHITHRLEYDRLLQDAEIVLDKLTTIEREVHTTDGRVFMMRVLPYRTAEDHINGVVVTFIDMTSRKQAEEALRQSEERFRIALSSAEMAAWDWDIGKDSIIWNDQHYTLLGLEPETAPRNVAFFRQFVFSDDLPMVDEHLRHACETGDNFHLEFRIRRAGSGEIRWMNGYGRVVAWQDERPSRMVGVMYDITNQKALERQKEEFISIASHELKTPVTSIKSYSEIMYERLIQGNDQKNADLMRKLGLQVDRLADLVSALLDTSRITEGQLQLRTEQFDLNTLVAEKIEELQRLTSKHTIHFHSGNLPPVTADRERISQVVTNLMSNAIKYAPGGGDIEITTRDDAEGYRFTIRDHGIGIAEEMRERIFDRFFRISNPQISTYPGMGLGLYISAGIIRRHGGTIFAGNPGGAGSMFTFILPHP